MPTAELLAGPSLPALENHAFDRATSIADSHPESVLYLAPTHHPREPTRDRWDDHGPGVCLRIETIEEFSAACYERDQYEGRATIVDRPLLFRLVELGVERIDEPTNPLGAGDRFPRAGLVTEAEAIYTDLEFSGLLSASAMGDRLRTIGLDSHADAIAEFAAEIEAVREDVLADHLRQTYQTERLSHVTTMDTPLSELFPAIEAVVVGGFFRFDRLERDLLERLSSTWPTIALLPTQTGSEEADGLDVGIAPALETYEGLGFTREEPDLVRRPRSESPGEAIDARRRIAASLYRHLDETPPTADVDPAAIDCSVQTAATVPDEIRQVAKQLREELAAGTDPEAIGVVLTSPGEYARPVQELFEAYELPYTFQTDLPLSETSIGEIVDCFGRLTREPRPTAPLLTLVTNPLVTVAETDEPIDPQALARVSARIDSPNLDRVLDHLEPAAVAAIESLLADIDSLRDSDLEVLPGRIDALLVRLGVETSLDDSGPLPSDLVRRERAARERLDRILESLTTIAPVADPERGDSLDRLERAIATESVRLSGGPDHQRIVVCGLPESTYHTFETVYVLGLTDTHVPSDPARLAFARRLYEADPNMEERDVAAETRSRLGALLGTAASLTLSRPERSLDGEPYVEADLLTELRRPIDLEAITDETPDPAPGSPEDVQRNLGQAEPEAVLDAALDSALQAGTFDAEQHDRIAAGMACARARSEPTITPYDGQLSPETVAEVHPEADREPYSASRLETYTACGFKYYMRQVLGIEAPEPLQREPDAGARGSYIHDVLEHYYRSVQSEHGEPVDQRGDFEARQKRLLQVALDRLEEAFAEYPETAFQDAWLRSLLAGLGTPETNEYYGGSAATDVPSKGAIERGLFYRFLETEAEELAKTTARPTWFEARIGEPHSGGTSVSDTPAEIPTPAGTVPVHGLIDRIDTVPGTAPTQAVLRDYKTGRSTPSSASVLLGTNFQLPLYALLAEAALDIETVATAYYHVHPPTSVKPRSGLVTSQSMATWVRSDEVTTPVLRYSHPFFETHAAFRAFVEATTPDRLGRVTTAIEGGQFQPTVLDPADAGCRYCEYADVCDVRPEHRHRTIAAIDEDEEVDAYVPPLARNLDPEAVLPTGGDGDG